MLRRQSFVAALAALLLLTLSAGAMVASLATKNVNIAISEELQTVKGVGEKTAAKILAEREKNGPFKSLEDVATRVKGVGEKTVEHFKADGWVATATTPTPTMPKPTDK